ncbi:TFIIB-type zinc ribbon-containing protein [Oscillibacter hominis]|uniref:TFIIB-type zinc ribbon-containing protein n=1 Tax=Oscillibacter hominis TaxID=2763056 RepID=A0A7G9B712_9FIRM|nr:CD1247 N-terminal domain-containing protein [Oscillibacter hominis]QNL45343.1 TFIIB-type zinc ribbon-containing protein [Oscillibacter hominis]
MNISEKVSYLKGLAEGLALDAESKEGKLISVIIDILDDIALEIDDMQEEQCDLEDGLDAVSDDLADLESLVYEEEDDEEEEDEECYETVCPNCEEAIYFDDSILEEGEVICPNCGEKLEFDLSDLANEEKEEE